MLTCAFHALRQRLGIVGKPVCADLGLRGYPALYLAGEKDAKYSKLAASLHEEGIVRTRIAPKVGHNVHLEAPEVFAACVHSVATR